MFLLCKDDVAKEDGMFTHNFPFMITLPNRLYAFAAFSSEEISKYFKKMLRLDDDYQTVDIDVIEKSKLKESRHLYVFSKKSDVDRLFSDSEKSRCRMRNVIEIAKVRSQ
jgi:hypothetical protein